VPTSSRLKRSKRVWTAAWLSITGALGRNLFWGGQKFWSYHRAQLRQAGVGSAGQLCCGDLTELGKAAMSPRRALDKLLKETRHGQAEHTKSALLPIPITS